MKTEIIVFFDVEALHQWEAAAQILPEVGFLSFLHFHKFKIKAKKIVTTGDNERPIEIITFKRELEDYFKRNFWDVHYNCCNLGNSSCEKIGLDLLEAYDLSYVEILEDGHWGSCVQA